MRRIIAPIRKKLNKIISNRSRIIFVKRRLQKEIELNDKFI